MENYNKYYDTFFEKEHFLSEACGVITDKNEIIKCENVSVDSENNFAIGKEKWETLHKQNKIIGTIHTHSYWHNSTPSKQDIQYAKKYKHESILITFRVPKVIFYNGDGIKKTIKLKITPEQKAVYKQLREVIKDLEKEKEAKAGKKTLKKRHYEYKAKYKDAKNSGDKALRKKRKITQ